MRVCLHSPSLKKRKCELTSRTYHLQSSAKLKTYYLFYILIKQTHPSLQQHLARYGLCSEILALLLVRLSEETTDNSAKRSYFVKRRNVC